jgi:hypothetical protein
MIGAPDRPKGEEFCGWELSRLARLISEPALVEGFLEFCNDLQQLFGIPFNRFLTAQLLPVLHFVIVHGALPSKNMKMRAAA